jgi:DNA-binding transcriptional MerR regulator/methylmalonyl-CoA mutase cobalamin-binding subunit
MRDEQSQTSSGLSIGAVSKATGIPTATLRTWERRYGFPSPERNGSGHRVYQPDVIDHLRLIDQALEAGHRASDIVSLDRNQIEALVDQSGIPLSSNDEADQPDVTDTSASSMPASNTAETAARADDTPDKDGWLGEWMDAAIDLDGDTLGRLFRNAWNRLGGLAFLNERAAPFLQEIGERWRSGELGIVHEHYTSQALRDFLSSQWRPLSDRSRGPKAILATLPGEDHALGLHLAAVVLAMAGWQIVFLGPRTPLADIVHASRVDGVRAVFLSIAAAFDSDDARDSLTALRRIVDADVDLVAGGMGAPDDLDDIVRFHSLDAFYQWAEERVDSS